MDKPTLPSSPTNPAVVKFNGLASVEARVRARVLDMTPTVAKRIHFPGTGRVSFWPTACKAIWVSNITNPHPAGPGMKSRRRSMFTILWKMPNGGEEIYIAPGISKIPVADVASDQLDCGGREHVAFQHLDGHAMTRDVGELFVMNSDGKTVATYRFWI